MSVQYEYDVFIIGGGINGVGIALEAAGAGLKVGLCEQDDLAAHTSSASSKLIHGGLRYLEQYDFGLVRRALKERSLLQSRAPHIIHEQRFIMPHVAQMRPAWMIQAGLCLYDYLYPWHQFSKARRLTLDTRAGLQLQDNYTIGFAYSDCVVDDARLVVLNAQLAHQYGAHIFTRARCTRASPFEGQWQVFVNHNGEQRQYRAKMLINAAGPWVNTVLKDICLSQAKHAVRLVQGSHIVVPRQYEGTQAYVLQQPDGRIVFVVPYQGHTMIGTTEKTLDTSLDKLVMDAQEQGYLITAYNRFFKTPLSAADVIHHWSGVRTLLDNAQSSHTTLSREHLIDCDSTRGIPLMTIYGGKITTYRTLAKEAMRHVRQYCPQARPFNSAAVLLPGGDMGTDVDHYAHRLHSIYPELPSTLLYRLAHTYGAQTPVLLGDARVMSDLGQDYGEGFTQKEIAYCMQHEFARTVEDILWRRTQMGLHLSAAQQQAITMDNQVIGSVTPS